MDMTSAGGRAPSAVARHGLTDRVPPVLRIAAGLVTVVAGWVVMVLPGRSLVVLSMVVGVVLLVMAVVELWTAITARAGEASSRVLGVIVGLLLLIGGVVCLRHPVLTMELLTLVLGLAWLVGGVVEIYRAVTGSDDRFVSGAAGVVNVLIGIVVLVAPRASAVGIVWLVGAALVVVGVVAVVRGFRARSSRREAARQD